MRLTSFKFVIAEARREVAERNPTFMGVPLLAMERDELLAVAHALGLIVRMQSFGVAPSSQLEEALSEAVNA